MIRYLIPLSLFIAIVAFLAVGLNRDPSLVPSPLVGKPAPEFSMPRLKDPDETVSRSDLLGKVSLLNVWATWCVSCRTEHPLLVELANQGQLSIYGLNYKDDRDDAIRWLEQLGDPYVASVYDPDGRLGFDLGVYGLPETFVMDPHGVIAYKHIGPIDADAWQKKILPVIQALQKAGG